MEDKTGEVGQSAKGVQKIAGCRRKEVVCIKCDVATKVDSARRLHCNKAPAEER